MKSAISAANMYQEEQMYYSPAETVGCCTTLYLGQNSLRPDCSATALHNAAEAPAILIRVERGRMATAHPSFGIGDFVNIVSHHKKAFHSIEIMTSTRPSPVRRANIQ
jgi:hypothetical protein